MKQSVSLAELEERVLAFREARDWEQFHNPKDMAISLVLEATELLEHFQWKNNEEALAHTVTGKEDISDELADVFYWVLLIAHDLHIDITQATLNKLKKNALKYPISKSKGSFKKYTELS
jgi:dCTP diphosphatase